MPIIPNRSSFRWNDCYEDKTAKNVDKLVAQKDLIKLDSFIKFEGFHKGNAEINILTKEDFNRLLKIAKSYSNKSYKRFRDYVLLHPLLNGMFRKNDENIREEQERITWWLERQAMLKNFEWLPPTFSNLITKLILIVK